MRLVSAVIPHAIIHGPYYDKQIDRRIVNVQTETRRGNMTYARFLMQEHLGRKLLPDEHVDHVNDDHLDDRIENLQILSPAKNTWKAQAHTWHPSRFYEFTCPECGGPGIQLTREVLSNRRKGRAGPFCGRSCAGRHNQRAQIAQRQEARP